MGVPGYDSAAAYRYGLLVQAAYELFQQNRARSTPSSPAHLPAGYTISLYLWAVDHSQRDSTHQLFGFAAQSIDDPGVKVVAIRGSDKLIRWCVDAAFEPKPFASVPNAGEVEDGFLCVYESLIGETPGGDPVSDIRGFLQHEAQNGSIVITGHGLGAAVANLLALDIAVNAPVADLTVYTLAAPRTGDRAFCDAFNRHVPRCFRVANEPDIVPALPSRYEQLNGCERIDSRQMTGIGHSVSAYHEIATYLAALNPTP